MGEARDCHILRLSLHHWRNLAHSRTQLYQRVTQLDNERRLRRVLNHWVRRLHDKRRVNWQNAMRTKLKNARDKRDSKLRKDAWAKWRQSYQSHLSRQHYSERLVIRFYWKWKDRLFSLDRMDTAADIRLSVIERRSIERTWNVWRRAADMRLLEKTVSERVYLRLMREAMSAWKQHL
jgi:protein SFI1